MSIQGVQSSNTYQPEISNVHKAEAAAEQDKLLNKQAEPVAQDEPLPRDEYIPSRRASLMAARPAEKPSVPEPETCTTDTTKVNREIKQLKDKRTELEQQVRSAPNPEKAEELSQKLAQVESQLMQKDNDTYRRQNAVVTNS